MIVILMELSWNIIDWMEYSWFEMIQLVSYDGN